MEVFCNELRKHFNFAHCILTGAGFVMVVNMCKNEEERLLYHEYKPVQDEDNNISDGSNDSDQSDCEKLNLRDLIGFLLAMLTAFW